METNKMKKKIRIPWYKVPKDILLDVVESTGLDPRKIRWYVNVEKKDVVYEHA